MNRDDLLRILKSVFLVTVPRVLFLYVLAPVLLLILFAQPIAGAVPGSDSAAYLILLVSLGAVVLNWLVYGVIRRKHPSQLVFAYGAFCLLAFVTVMYLALPGTNPLVSTLSIIGVTLLQVVLILLSFWFASLKTKPACAAAVAIRVVVGLFLTIMAGQVVRDFEANIVDGFTWLTLGILIALIMGLFGARILAAFRRNASRRRATGLAIGRIVKIVGETHLDHYDDLVTVFHAHIQYMVRDVSYETRADITRFTLRRYGKEAFIGGEVPVRYDPADPARAYAEPVRKPAPQDISGEEDSDDFSGMDIHLTDMP